jgi:UDP-3-O-[3-hydroxymyristoyl] glucosamine N-acyltransferase
LKPRATVAYAAQSGVMHDIGDGQKWFGYPAQPDRQMKRQLLALHQLPDLLRRVQALEKWIGKSSSSSSAKAA